MTASQMFDKFLTFLTHTIETVQQLAVVYMITENRIFCYVNLAPCVKCCSVLSRRLKNNIAVIELLLLKHIYHYHDFFALHTKLPCHVCKLFVSNKHVNY